MANYSAQKLKSVSLNNQERRYANQDGNNTARPENRTVTAAKKPLITPLWFRSTSAVLKAVATTESSKVVVRY